MLLEELNYKIPENLIALHPKKPRDDSKLIVVKKQLQIIRFKEIIDFLKPNDALVFNDTKVINAYLEGTIKERKILINLNKIVDQKNVIWDAFIKSNKKPQIGDEIIFPDNLTAKVINISRSTNIDCFILKFLCTFPVFKKKLNLLGLIPLPPYIIKRRKIKKSDFTDYQTVFAKNEGAVASPTASLHFSKKLLKKIKEKKIKIVNVTLHINGGTFLPVKEKNIFKHQMHYEYAYISKKSSEEINETRKKGGRIIAVGTTVLRVLESAKKNDGEMKPFDGETNIFIKPGWKINSIDGIITNFHLPKSTLLLIIYALIGKNRTKELYDFAIKNKLRFFSYGDASLILRENGKF